nr:mucin-1-like [Penaeus vannamei]
MLPEQRDAAPPRATSNPRTASLTSSEYPSASAGARVRGLLPPAASPSASLAAKDHFKSRRIKPPAPLPSAAAAEARARGPSATREPQSISRERRSAEHPALLWNPSRAEGAATPTADVDGTALTPAPVIPPLESILKGRLQVEGPSAATSETHASHGIRTSSPPSHGLSLRPVKRPNGLLRVDKEKKFMLWNNDIAPCLNLTLAGKKSGGRVFHGSTVQVNASERGATQVLDVSTRNRRLAIRPTIRAPLLTRRPSLGPSRSSPEALANCPCSPSSQAGASGSQVTCSSTSSGAR